MSEEVEVDEVTIPEEEANEYGRSVWDEVACRLSRTGFAGLTFRVVSGPGAPFAVEAGGAEGPARSVVNPGFREKLTKTVREVIAARSPESSRILSRGPDWPAFTIKLSQEIEPMEDFAPTTQRPYILGGLSQRDTPAPEPEPEELVKVPNDPPPVFLPDPGAPPRLETAPESREELTPLPPTPPGFACVHEPSESSLRRIARELGDLVVEKNAAYSNAFHAAGAFLRILYPNGVRLEQYDDMLAIVRVFDKLKRISGGNTFALGELAWRDIAKYAILSTERDEYDKNID